MSIRSWNAVATATACWPVIASSTSSESVGSGDVADALELGHQLLVDLQAAGGVDDHGVEPLGAGALEPGAHRLDRVGRVGAEDGNVDLRAELLELVDCGRALKVGGDQARLAAAGLELARELGGGRRLARALEPCEQDDGLALQLELGGLGPEQVGELLVDDLHHLLARVQPLRDLLVECALAHAGDEVVDDVEVDVRLDQREADLAHRPRDRLLVEATALAQAAECRSEPFGEGVEHRVSV